MHSDVCILVKVLEQYPVARYCPVRNREWSEKSGQQKWLAKSGQQPQPQQSCFQPCQIFLVPFPVHLTSKDESGEKNAEVWRMQDVDAARPQFVNVKCEHGRMFF